MVRTSRTPRPRSRKRHSPPHPENGRRRDERIQAQTTLLRVATELIAAKGLENVTLERTFGIGSEAFLMAGLETLKTLWPTRGSASPKTDGWAIRARTGWLPKDEFGSVYRRHS